MSFSHIHARSLSEAAGILSSRSGAQVVAGGTDLLGTVKDRVHDAMPEVLVNLKTVEGIDGIEETGEGGLSIGALARLADLEAHPLVRERFPVLAEAAHTVASPQLRNMGTVGGNICQEPRCWYYRAPENTFFCTRKGGRYCNALAGENRFHSIYGSARVSVRPCTEACPGGVQIPEYLSLLRAGDTEGACRLLLARNPMPAVTGRVCPHFCEGECNRSLFDEAVSVRAVERFLGDHILDHSERFLAPPAGESGVSVAVVGSGPAGLSAAYYLRRAGHRVIVYEREAEAGGMLRYGIPAYRLPKSVLERLLTGYAHMGIEFRVGVELGKDIDFDRLRRETDGLFLATGAWATPRIGLQGEEELRSGLSFLAAQAKGGASVPGPRLVVIGGGNVAVDVAVTAKRLGSERVTMVCVESREEMPALPWEIEEALAEGIDILPSFGPAVLVKEKGRLTGVELHRCTSVFDETGAFCPVYAREERRTLEADEIILAVGQRSEVDLLERTGLSLENGLVCVEESTQATSSAGVYAGGDLTTGPATVISALAAGRRAARAFPAAVEGIGAGAEAEAVGGNGASASPSLDSCAPAALAPSVPVCISTVPPEDRTLAQEDTATIAAEHAGYEVARCFNCGCVAVTCSDLAPVLVALDASIGTTTRELPASEFFAASVGGSTVLAPGELVERVKLPPRAAEWRCRYEKFRLRNTIDFPIVGAACALHVHEGVIDEARIVLGAAAPVPVRAHAAEASLVGLRPSEVDMAEVAAQALAGTIPLATNSYKVRIAGALVERALHKLCREAEAHGCADAGEGQRPR